MNVFSNFAGLAPGHVLKLTPLPVRPVPRRPNERDLRCLECMELGKPRWTHGVSYGTAALWDLLPSAWGFGVHGVSAPSSTALLSLPFSLFPQGPVTWDWRNVLPPHGKILYVSPPFLGQEPGDDSGEGKRPRQKDKLPSYPRNLNCPVIKLNQHCNNNSLFPEHLSARCQPFTVLSPS